MPSYDDIALMQLDADSGKRLLKKIILDANPGLSDSTVKIFEKMNILRRWVSANIPHGNETQIYDHSILHNLTNCITGKGAVLCSGFAEFLGYIYGLFSLNAVVYDHGIPGVCTHVITLVNESGIDPYVQDATCNATYAHTDGTPMTFGVMCELLKAHRSADIIRIMDSGERKRAKKRDLFSFSEEMSISSEEVAAFVRREDEKIAHRVATFSAAKNWLSLHGFPIEPEYIFLSRLSVKFPRGKVTSPGNVLAFVNNSTISYRDDPHGK